MMQLSVCLCVCVRATRNVFHQSMSHTVMALFVCACLTSCTDTQTDTHADKSLPLNTTLALKPEGHLHSIEREEKILVMPRTPSPPHTHFFFFFPPQCAQCFWEYNTTEFTKFTFFSCCIALSKIKPTHPHTLQHLASHCPSLSPSLTSHARLSDVLNFLKLGHFQK